MKYYIVESGGVDNQQYQVVKHDRATGREIIKASDDMGGDELFETTEDALRALLEHLGISFAEMLSADYIAALLADIKSEEG